MPSTYAHRRFGADVLQQLPAALQDQIGKNRALFDVGLHGPDLLFYYHAAKSNPVSALGNAMHEQPGRVFFERARGVVRQAKDRDAALAYALGFVCHFALDSTCHPYVEAYTRQSGVSHCEIETEFDDMLLRRDGHDPKSFFTASHIRPTAENARVIAPFYEGLTGLQVLDALKGMIAMHRLLQPSGAVKRWVVLTGMKAVGKYDVLHGLVANPQPNPQCTESNEKLDALYQQAIPLAVRLITADAIISLPSYLTTMFVQQRLVTLGWDASWLFVSPLLASAAAMVCTALARRLHPGKLRPLYRLCALVCGGGVLLAGAGPAWGCLVGPMLVQASLSVWFLHAMQRFNDAIPSDRRATLISVDNMAYSVLMIPASPLIGLIADVTGLAGAGLCALGGLVLLSALALPRRK